MIFLRLWYDFYFVIYSNRNKIDQSFIQFKSILKN